MEHKVQQVLQVKQEQLVLMEHKVLQDLRVKKVTMVM
tara:strand:- start:220 stop:330 length:111 start_codon:yes stop_codon:yes gene_type:complete